MEVASITAAIARQKQTLQMQLSLLTLYDDRELKQYPKHRLNEIN